MIDSFALAISHGLLAIAVWRLMQRPDLNRDDRAGGGGAPGKGWRGRA